MNRRIRHPSRSTVIYSDSDSDCPMVTNRMEYDHSTDHGMRYRAENLVPQDSNQLSQLASLMHQLTENVVKMQGNVAGPSHTSRFGGDSVPIFDPEIRNQNTDLWIKKVEELRIVFSWTEPVTIHHAISKFKGLALTWYRGLSSLNYTWEEWKTLLRQSFPSKYDYYGKLEEMMNRVKEPKESMTRYFYEKLALLNMCKIYKEDAVSCIIGGIKDYIIQSAARAGGHETPEDLLAFLKAFDRKPITTNFSNDERKHGFKRRHYHASKQSYKTIKNSVTCYRCDKPGHISTACPMPCKICKNTGHSKNRCKERPTTSRTALVVNTTHKSPNEKYFVDASVNGVQVRGYVDFGSSCVIIQKSEAERLGLPIDSSKTTVIRGFGAGEVKTSGVTTFELEVDNAKATVMAEVVDDYVQRIPLLIGQPFTEAPNITVIKSSKNLRIFDHKKHKIPEMDLVPPEKICLWAKSATVIPSNCIGHIPVWTKNPNFTGDLYIEAAVRDKGEPEYCIPGTVLHISAENTAVLPIVNISEKELTISPKTAIAKAWLCEPESQQTSTEQVLYSEHNSSTPLSTADIKTGPLDHKSHEQLVLLLQNYRNCFARDLNELGKAKSATMAIRLASDSPVTYRPYRMSLQEREKVRCTVQELLECGIVQESQSPYASPVLLVKKKSGEDRMCIDYRKLNALTVKDRYPLPRIDDQLDRLHGSRYFTTLDLSSGYHQIPIEAESKHLTSFITPDGQYEYNRMPFGLANAPSVFQRLMNKVLGSLRYNAVSVYLDDVLIPSKSVDEGIKLLEEVLKVLQEEGLTLRLSKCVFLETTTTYLGFQIDKDGVRPGEHKIRAIQEFPVPTDVHTVRQFVGLASYFRQFIPNFAVKARPLTSLTKKNSVWTWSHEQMNAYQELKNILSTRPLLALYDPTAPTEVHTDASKWGLAGILLQSQRDEQLHPVAYFSRQTSRSEQQFHSYELEALAVVESLRKFRVYLIGISFKVVTDCNALKTAQTKRDLVPRIARWWLQLAEFNFTVEYRPGVQMGHADALSRNPAQTEIDCTANEVLHIETTDWVLAGQLTDRKIQNIREILAGAATNEEEQKIHHEYTQKNGRIYRNTTAGLKFVVAKGQRSQALRWSHDDFGHFGVDKTLDKLAETYWFEGMKQYTENYIKCCVHCLYHKWPKGKKEGMLHPIDKAATPFHTIHVDHLGPFVRSKSGNTQLIVVVEAFTKYTFLKAVKNTKAKHVIDLFKEIFGTYGITTRIISDRGASFTSKLFRDFCEEHGIKHVLNAVATPRANGQVERFNQTTLTALAASCHDNVTWDTKVPTIEFSLNNTICRATGKTPSELLFGFRPRAPADAILSNEVQDERPNIQNVEAARTRAAAKIKNDQLKQKIRFDSKRKLARVYNEGDLVVIKKQFVGDTSSHKLIPPYAGPFQVQEVLPNDRYVVGDMEGSTRSKRAPYRNVVAVDRMKPWTPSNESDTSSDEHVLD